MKARAVTSLQCPFCLGPIDVAEVKQEKDGDIESGLLSCTGCRFEFPVIAGILILMSPDERIDVQGETSTSAVSGGPSVRELVRLVRSGGSQAALALLLGPAHDEGTLFPRLEVSAWHKDDVGRSRAPRQSRDRAGSTAPAGRLRDRLRPWVHTVRRWARRIRAPLRRLLLPRARTRLARFLESHAGQLSALDAIALYYGRYSGTETGNYFAFRFGQPRHLASLGVASTLSRTDGPILDLACGAGHLTHYLTSAFPDREVFGVDRAFFRLLLARRYVAPQASFLCADADRALPFQEKSLGGVFCSDAFHFFVHRAATIRECQRVLREHGLIVFTRFGNVEVPPREGHELSIEGYRRLLGGWPHVFFDEDELVDLYLQRRSPDLDKESPSAALRERKWLSLVLARDPDDLGTGAEFAEWPHSIGRLRLNPIYVARPVAGGDLELEFRFPSSWYGFENRRYLEYAPERARISKAEVDCLARGDVPPSVEALVAQCVLIGLPERYIQ